MVKKEINEWNKQRSSNFNISTGLPILPLNKISQNNSQKFNSHNINLLNESNDNN